MKIQALSKKNGQLSLQILIFGSIAVILLSGFFVWVEVNVKSAVRQLNRSTAFTIAEAGIEYYRWHLAHASGDYQDGTGQPGPYTHNYYDKDGNLVGQFILEITPPPLGSSVVNIKSTGKIVKDSGIEKVIKVKMAIPSFAKYAAVLNADVRFGAGTEVYGEIHSNGGVRFDGLAHNLVTSALGSYDDPDHDPGVYEFGVHTHVSPVDPLPPAAVPNRTDVFEVGRSFPVPAVDFAGITQALSQIKTDSQSAGFYASSSGGYGYEVVLKTNDTFDLYRVSTLVPRPGQCTDYSSSQYGWGTWSIQATSSIGNYPFPSNGLMFLEDDVWVRGQINTARLTIASARFPDNSSTRSSITINNDVLYTNYDGQDVISLIAQRNINIGLRSENDLRVDAALMAQNGRVGRYYYVSGCGSYYIRSVITAYGMIASSQRYGFAYVNGTGYQTRNIVYDSNLLYGPPPSFPKTSDSYETIYWDEVK
ncbi:hypothetical protein HZB06_02450 [Candidatus Wolfebacteria bacterium]|nr:hypothetical protein [Candidatus Wolfebacteria bacterium]